MKKLMEAQALHLVGKPIEDDSALIKKWRLEDSLVDTIIARLETPPVESQVDLQKANQEWFEQFTTKQTEHQRAWEESQAEKQADLQRQFKALEQQWHNENRDTGQEANEIFSRGNLLALFAILISIVALGIAIAQLMRT